MSVRDYTLTGNSSRHRWYESAWQVMALVLAVALGHALLFATPGYFSHDELAWAARASVDTLVELPWVSWTDTSPFLYRPLAHNFWLLLAHACHGSPHLFHAVWVVFGALIAVMLQQVLRRVGVRDSIAFAGALVFALNPYAVYVHGWVATSADLLWVGSGLGLAVWLTRPAATGDLAWRSCLAGAIAAAAALLSKEAAIVLAPLAWLAWALLGRSRTWFWAAVGLSLPTIVYLVLRVDTLLYAPRLDDGYGWSLLNVPLNWVYFQLYLPMLTTFEVGTVQSASVGRLVAASILLLVVVWTLFVANWRLAIAFVVGSAVALGPVLLLDEIYNQYAYGASALLVMVAALAWSGVRRSGRAVLVMTALLWTWHGVNVQRDLHRVGTLQARFSPSLSRVVAAHPERIITLSIDRPADRWVYARLTYDPLAYGSDRTRVRIVPPGQMGMFRATYNGEVVTAGNP